MGAVAGARRLRPLARGHDTSVIPESTCLGSIVVLSWIALTSLRVRLLVCNALAFVLGAPGVAWADETPHEATPENVFAEFGGGVGLTLDDQYVHRLNLFGFEHDAQPFFVYSVAAGYWPSPYLGVLGEIRNLDVGNVIRFDQKFEWATWGTGLWLRFGPPHRHGGRIYVEAGGGFAWSNTHLDEWVTSPIDGSASGTRDVSESDSGWYVGAAAGFDMPIVSIVGCFLQMKAHVAQVPENGIGDSRNGLSLALLTGMRLSDGGRP